MSDPAPAQPHTAFAGDALIASGPLRDVALALKKLSDAAAEPAAPTFLVFSDETGRLVDLDLSGVERDVAARVGGPPATEHGGSFEGLRRGPGRPKLGVVSREVTLLPRHWAWLRAQRGGASGTLRRLVEQARRREAGADEVRRSQDRTYRFMTAVLGDAPGYEEALRALYAGDRESFERESESWPRDLRRYALRLGDRALPAEAETAHGATPAGDMTSGGSGRTK